MRRLNGDTIAVGRAGAHLRLAAVVLMTLGLAALVPSGARGDEPAPGYGVGQRVVAWSGGLALHDDRGEVADIGGTGQVYRVERMDGDRLWLRAEGEEQGGWVTADEVVAAPPPIDPSVRPAGGPLADLGAGLAALGRSVRVEVLLQQAEAAIDRKDFDRAITTCDEVIRLDHQEPDSYFLRGSARAMRNQFDEAIPDLDEAIRLDPQHADALILRAAIRLRRNEPDRAIADLDEAIGLDPTDPMAFRHRGSARSMKREYRKALADYDEAIRLDPRAARAYVRRAGVREQLGQTDQALADCNKALELDARDAAAYCVRGHVRLGRGELDEALADLDQAIRLDPRMAASFCNRGAVWFKKREWAKPRSG